MKLQVEELEIEVLQKNIRSIRLSVRAPEGDVRVSAPKTLRASALQAFVISKVDWIREQQQKVRARHQHQRLFYVEDERHPVWGELCTLNIVKQKGVPAVFLDGEVLVLTERPGSTAQKRKALLEAWYRDQLKEALPDLIKKYEQRMQVSVHDFGIKKMKTRWGTCNTRAKRVWFSLELAKKAPILLEYVVVHELVHLLEASHNACFKALMDNFMPDWRLHRAALKK